MRNKKQLLVVLVLLAIILYTCIPTTAYSHDNFSCVLGNEPSTIDYTVTYHNYVTNETRISNTEDCPTYNYQCSYECMNPDDLVLSRQADEEYFRKKSSATNKQNTTRTSSVYVVDPDSDILYKGILLLVVYATNPQGNVVPYQHGSGILAGGKTIVSAAHVAAPTLPEGWSNPQVRVYYGIHFTASSSNPFSSLNSYSYYTVYECNYGSDSSISTDWYVGTLSSSISNAYYFNCYVTDSSVVGEDTFCAGYAGGNKFKKSESQGSALAFYPSFGNLMVSNTIESGMSGGPIYAHVGGRSCIAINRAYNSTTGNGYGTLITDQILDYIIDSILS